MPDYLSVRLQIYFDNNFLGLHKQSMRQSKIKLKEIFGHLQLLFHHKSLGTKINLEIVTDPILVPNQVCVYSSVSQPVLHKGKLIRNNGSSADNVK